MEDITRELYAAYSTNNPVVDILIGNKLGIAEELGIQVECALLLPVPCAVRDIDFCIITANKPDRRTSGSLREEADMLGADIIYVTREYFDEADSKFAVNLRRDYRRVL